MEEILKSLRPRIRKLNKDPQDTDVLLEIREEFEPLLRFELHYVIKENVLFPVLERSWPDFRCLQVMWSFHDDIRRNQKAMWELLQSSTFDITAFNRMAGDLFFNMLAIKFREEHIIFPVMMETISQREIDSLLGHCKGLEFPYIQPDFKVSGVPDRPDKDNSNGFMTGALTEKQAELIFDHLPVDITFVDEHNKVRYFSSPAHRIFPRAKSIIGRDVRNCHPPESVHIVEEIIEEFRKGGSDQASFWIDMSKKKILIRYFAVRDDKGTYCGVLEVSQDISNIQGLEGEQRLPDWNK